MSCAMLGSVLTAVAIPVKVVLGVAVALVVKAVLLTGRAVGEGDVVVGDIVEEVNLVLLQHQSCGQRMDGRITPSLVEETTGAIEGLEIVDVGLGSEPVKVTNLKIGPEVAVVVGLAVVVADELQRIVLGNVLGERLGEVLGCLPESRDGLDVFVQRKREGVLLVVISHELEGVVVDIAVHLDAGLNAPVPLVVEHQRVAEEEARLVAAHVPVADGVAVDDLLLLHLLADAGGLVLVNEIGERPVLLGDLAVLGLTRDQGSGDLLELVVEIVVVQEDPIVIELAVEAVLDVSNRLGNLPDVLVTGKGDEGGIHAVAGHGRGRQLVGVGC